MKKQLYILTVSTAILLCAGGCKEAHPAPPLERSELVLRFFQSIQQNRPEDAVLQGKKLEVHLYDKSLITSLTARQQSNSYLALAQQALNRLDHAAAEKAIRAGRRQYPNNRTLKQAEAKLQQLKPSPRLLAEMEKASSAPAMAAALTAATASVGSNTTPELEKYFVRYRARIALQQAKERKQFQEPLNIPDDVFED